MDRFELNWPNMDAQLLTDGWRCRIVWRQKGQRSRHGSGPGGTIDNNLLCVRRVAESLEGAPDLLNALKARGHERLASQIEALVATGGAEGAAASGPSASGSPAAARPAKPAPAPDPDRWLDALQGEASFQASRAKRAKVWLELGPLPESGEVLLLKTPAAKGKAEWVVKRTWPEEPGRKPEYVASAAFKGIAAWLLEAGADDAFLERLFAVAAPEIHPELAAASAAWHAAR